LIALRVTIHEEFGIHQLHHVRPKMGTEISERGGGIQTSANGTERALSAEQLLSHILPLLAGLGHFTVRAEPDMINCKLSDDVKTHRFEE
jgi:hypothetical protein